MPDSGRKDLILMKRPLAYITAPWSENEFEKPLYSFLPGLKQPPVVLLDIVP